MNQAFRGTKQTQLQAVGTGRYSLPLVWSTWNRIRLTQDGDALQACRACSHLVQATRAHLTHAKHSSRAKSEGKHLDDLQP